MKTKVYVIPHKRMVTVDRKRGNISSERYYRIGVPDNFQIDSRKWRYLDEQRGYVEVDVSDGDLHDLPEAPQMSAGLYAIAVGVKTGKALPGPQFLPDSESKRLGTIIDGNGKQWRQGSEYRWQTCTAGTPGAVELQKPIPVNDGKCITEFVDGVPDDCGALDEETGIPVSVMRQRIEALALEER